MRLFTAITLPETVRNELIALQPRHPEINLTPPSQLHLTLRYIGEVDKARTRRIIHTLTHVSFRPFDITLMGTGCFPNPKTPFILWAGIRYHAVLRELYDAMQEELYRVGIPLENRTFHPHITLGRFRKNRKETITGNGSFPDQLFNEFLEGSPSRFRMTFHVDRFRLYQSRIHSGGAIHHCLQEYSGS